MDQPLVAVPEQSTAWIYAAWTNGFALLALIAVILEERFSDHHIAPSRVKRAIATALCAVLATVVIIMLAVAKLELPTLVTQNGFTIVSLAVRWLSIILLCSGICLILFVMREPSDLYLWLSWALTAMVFYTVLSTVGGHGSALAGISDGLAGWSQHGCSLYFLYFSLLGQFRAACLCR